ncbi:uncharacterized protein LOC132167785 [Corylus avellana]|uniref:uncharacterized protein LOC132167785 n=1 Tax=Corylus avellana TaxID=13451 RepID=UPI001E238B16|nr:uncharacterized protein LOC132167785 [Corylus avellana]
MALRIKTVILLLLILLIPLSGIVEGFKDGTIPYHSLYKDGSRMKLRKLLELDSLLDYDDAGANPRHDPRRKPGNGGGRNP